MRRRNHRVADSPALAFRASLLARLPTAALGVVVVGPTLTALRGRLPGVLRPPELTLRKVVEPLLLAPEELQLVGPFVGVDVRRIERRVRRVRGRMCLATE